MNYQQTTIFDFLETQRINYQNIRLIELFAGYGSQSLALKYLNLDYEHYKICEWAVKSIQAYNDLHIRDYTDYSKGLDIETITDRLVKYGISADYSKPMTREQIKRKGEEWKRQVYNNIIATHNLVNISTTTAKDLQITNTQHYTYLVTYSFPCQDLSLAGKQQGMSRDSGTRSGLLWEVERILNECEELPQILLMENVPTILGKSNAKDFESWKSFLTGKGYANFVEILNAKDYGIPQNRKRCFMISILNGQDYIFPKKLDLKLRLKDLLEKEVDEKFYLSDKMVKYISQTGTENYANRNSKINLDVARPLTTEPNKRAGTTTYIGDDLPDNYDLSDDRPRLKATIINNKEKVEDACFIDVYNRSVNNSGVSGAITTRVSNANNTFIAEEENNKLIQVGSLKGSGLPWDNMNESTCRVYSEEGISPTLDTMQGGHRQPKVLINEEENLKRQLCNDLIQNNKVEEYDVIRHNYSNSRMDGKAKGIHQENNISPTLDTRCDCLGVAVNTETVNLKRGYSCEIKPEKESTEDIDIIGNYSKSNYNQTSIVGKNGVAPTVTENHGQVTAISVNKPQVIAGIGDKKSNNGTQWYQQDRIYDDKVAISVTTSFNPYYQSNLRIRKLTPKECFRLMGVKDKDYDNIAANQSNASLYHLAGDSIVTTVLMAIFGELFGADWESKIQQLLTEVQDG